MICRAVRSSSGRVEAIIVPVTVEAVKAGLECANVERIMLDSTGFKGETGQVYSQLHEGRVLGFVGLGVSADVNTDILRQVGATIARSWKRHSCVAVDMETIDDLNVDVAEGRQAIAEGVLLGAYRFTAYKSQLGDSSASADSSEKSGTDEVTCVEIMGNDSESAVDAIARATSIVSGVCSARDLVNEPGGSLTPPVFARRVKKIARESGLWCEVWNKKEIKKQKLGGLLGVNRGSEHPPRLVRISYHPRLQESDATVPTVALVGKGITFDSGGLCIKRAKPMLGMKMDMAGAAAVVGAMSVLPAVEAKVSVEAYLPMTDNMLGGDATRPGDVLTIRNGKTIEVANTDAEGRLILADALCLASEAKPDAIIDVATLTGACMVALGFRIAGLMGNNESWVRQVREAADTAGERVWPLPLPVDYEQQFESEVADIKNLGLTQGGALTAGLILRKFVPDSIPWAHLDIAGPAFSDSEDGEICKGGTGFGVRLIVEVIRSFSKPEVN